jgi:hypothetical protein
MSQTFFQDIQAKAFRSGINPRTKDASKWFKEQIKNMQTPKRYDLLNDSLVKRKSKPTVGSLCMFFYDPKHADTLPYYDMFPMVIMTEAVPGGFKGLNMHYLHPGARAKLFDALLETTNNKFMNESTKFQLTYKLLKGVSKFKEFAPCYKHYLIKHVESGVSVVEAPEWEIAMMLPVQQFAKATANYVWSQSKKAY